MKTVVAVILALVLGYKVGRRRDQQVEGTELVEVIGPAEVRSEYGGVHVDEGACIVISVDSVG